MAVVLKYTAKHGKKKMSDDSHRPGFFRMHRLGQKIFYTPEKIGKNDTRFSQWKIRTMIEGAEAKTEEMRSKNGVGIFGKPAGFQHFVTPIGKFLRKFHFDELPQVLQTKPFNPWGSLNLVGMRPVTQSRLGVFPEDIRQAYNQNGPGLFGIWNCLKELPKTDAEYVQALRTYYSERNEAPVKTDLKYLFNWFRYSFLMGRMSE
jgi:lipopolysaccharide/colanic/teichoic acid biosynthesis glycosyltransferase